MVVVLAVVAAVLVQRPSRQWGTLRGLLSSYWTRPSHFIATAGAPSACDRLSVLCWIALTPSMAFKTTVLPRPSAMLRLST